MRDPVSSVNLRAAITQQPERQFTSGLVCVKAPLSGFHAHQSACELSLGSLSYSRSTLPRFSPRTSYSVTFCTSERVLRRSRSAETTLSPLSRRSPQARRGRRGPPYGDLSCVALSRMLRGCCGALLAAHILPQIVRVRRLTLTCSRGPLCGLPRATAAAADGLPACSSSWYAPTGPRACAA